MGGGRRWVEEADVKETRGVGGEGMENHIKSSIFLLSKYLS
jgi:hypothetical protein